MTDGNRDSTAMKCDASEDQIHFSMVVDSANVDSGQVWPNLSTGFQVWSTVSNGTNVRMFVDNDASAIVTDTTDYSSYNRDLTVNSAHVAFAIGSGLGLQAANTFLGQIHEVIIYNAILSDDNIDVVRAHLVSKYGL